MLQKIRRFAAIRPNGFGIGVGVSYALDPFFIPVQGMDLVLLGALVEPRSPYYMQESG